MLLPHKVPSGLNVSKPANFINTCSQLQVDELVGLENRPVCLAPFLSGTGWFISPLIILDTNVCEATTTPSAFLGQLRLQRQLRQLLQH